MNDFIVLSVGPVALWGGTELSVRQAVALAEFLKRRGRLQRSEGIALVATYLIFVILKIVIDRT